MTLEFRDHNEAVAYYAKELLRSSSVSSTNEANSDRYKNKLGGEVLQDFFKIKDSTAVLSTWKNHKYHDWWLHGEIFSEMLNLDPPLMYKYRPEMFGQHYDLLEDGRMQYTYSNRWVEFSQFVNLHRRLQKNPNSKRGVVPIFTPYDTAPERADSPCTVGYMFTHRDGKLHMTTSYRSWDFFGGFKSYDFGLSSFVQQSFCSWLDMEPGDLAFMVQSLHYYQRDHEELENLVDEVIQDPERRSKKLIVDGNLKMGEFYNELRRAKMTEEMSYAGNFEEADRIKDELSVDYFKTMSDSFINRNKRRFDGKK